MSAGEWYPDQWPFPTVWIPVPRVSSPLIDTPEYGTVNSASRPSTLSVCQPAPAEPPSVAYLQSIVDRFEKAIEVLRVRVTPVLTPGPPTSCAAAIGTPPVSDLRDRLRTLDNLVSRLVETTEQIDL
jgi:hypothetical protein